MKKASRSAQTPLWILVLVSLVGLSQLAWAPPTTHHSQYALAAEQGPARTPSPQLQTLLKAGLPIEMEEAVGQPTFLWLGDGWLSTPPPQLGKDPVLVARWMLDTLRGLYGMTSEQVHGLDARLAHDTGFGNLVITFEHRINGVKVHHHRMSIMLKRGTLDPVAISGHFLPGYRPSTHDDARLDFDIPMDVAIAQAIVDRHGVGLDPLEIKNTGQTRHEYTYHTLSPSALTAIGPQARFEPIRIKPVFYAMPDGLEAAYYLELFSSEQNKPTAAWSYVVSARDARILERTSLDFDFDFTVWADQADGWPQDNPHGSSLTPLPIEADDNLLGNFIPPNTITIPTGFNTFEDPWLAPDATETLGNNVDAFADLAEGPTNQLNDGDLRGVVSEPGIFGHLYDPLQEPNASPEQQQADIQQLFYVNNYLHDLFYDHGFDEAAGNAQSDNYGRGGADGDRLITRAQSFTGANNANISVPADGASPLMNMFVWNRNTIRANVNAFGQDFTGNNLGLGIFNPFGDVDVTAPAFFVNDGVEPNTDGCEAINDDLTGQIAIIDRGSCTFGIKVVNAQNAGAVGVVIVNNRDGGITNLGGTPPEPTTIHAYMVPLSARQQLVDNEGESITITGTRGAARGSSMDTTITVHEWGHYLFGRLVPATGSVQTGGINEGHADFVSLLIAVRESDVEVPGNEQWQGRFPVGSHANNNAVFGIRRAPYSTDFGANGLTFAHIANNATIPDTFPQNGFGAPNAEVHNTGEIWGSMMWEVFVELLQRHPFEEARSRMMDYLVAGLKMSPPTPTFTELRSAIAAAMTADEGDFVATWEAFARRGIGSGATSPPRFDRDNVGGTESFELRKELGILGITLTEGAQNCDNDDVLDIGELGLVQVEVVNRSPLTIDDAVVTVDADPALLFTDGNTAPVPTLTPNARATVLLPVRLLEFETFANLSIAVTANAEGLIQPVEGVTQVAPLVHFNQIAQSSIQDDVEAPASPWTVTFDPARTEPVPAERKPNPALTGTAWHLPAEGAGITDQYLTSPPIDVAPEGDFTFAFDHVYRFETTDDVHYDAGVLELSTDGEVWTDIGEFADPGYNGQVTDLGAQANPLANRQAWVALNPSYPDADRVTVNLGAQFQGQTVQIRFRVGTDPAVGTEGWFIDNLAFENITNLPFTTVEPNDGPCPNSPPVANAGVDVEVNAEANVALDGSASNDPWLNPITLAWTQIEGPTVEITGADTANPQFTAPLVFEDTTLIFLLVVTAQDGRTSADVVNVTVLRANNDPVANAGQDIEVDENTAFTLDGSASNDPEDDPLTYAWVQIDGPDILLDDAAAPNPSATAPEVPQDTTATFELTVSDGDLTSPADEVVVTVVANQRPVANAGADLIMTEGESVVLDGSGSADPDGDELTFEWVQVDGPEVELIDSNTVAPTLTAPDINRDAVARFELTVSDGELTSTDEVEVTILRLNTAPVADAGVDGEVSEGQTLTLDGSGSADPDGDELTYAWSQLDGPSVALADAATATPTLTAPEVGQNTVVRLQLVVLDGAQTSEPDVVEINILNINQPPVADAGQDQSVASEQTVTLDGSDSADPDGGELAFVWTQTDGPEVELENKDQPKASFVAPSITEDTELVFEVEVTDSEGLSDTASVTVAITALPTVNVSGGKDGGCSVAAPTSPGHSPTTPLALGLLVLGALFIRRRR